MDMGHKWDTIWVRVGFEMGHNWGNNAAVGRYREMITLKMESIEWTLPGPKTGGGAEASISGSRDPVVNS